MTYFCFSRPPIPSIRGQRIAHRPSATNANRREYGKGMVGRLLNRTIKRKRLTSTVKKQMASLSDHRLAKTDVQRQALSDCLIIIMYVMFIKQAGVLYQVIQHEAQRKFRSEAE